MLVSQPVSHGQAYQQPATPRNNSEIRLGGNRGLEEERAPDVVTDSAARAATCQLGAMLRRAIAEIRDIRGASRHAGCGAGAHQKAAGNKSGQRATEARGDRANGGDGRSRPHQRFASPHVAEASQWHIKQQRRRYMGWGRCWLDNRGRWHIVGTKTGGRRHRELAFIISMAAPTDMIGGNTLAISPAGALRTRPIPVAPRCPPIWAANMGITGTCVSNPRMNCREQSRIVESQATRTDCDRSRSGSIIAQS